MVECWKLLAYDSALGLAADKKSNIQENQYPKTYLLEIEPHRHQQSLSYSWDSGQRISWMSNVSSLPGMRGYQGENAGTSYISPSRMRIAESRQNDDYNAAIISHKSGH